jgi:hypothetical protein
MSSWAEARCSAGQREGEIAVLGAVERQVLGGQDVFDHVEGIGAELDGVVRRKGVHGTHDPFAAGGEQPAAPESPAALKLICFAAGASSGSFLK